MLYYFLINMHQYGIQDYGSVGFEMINVAQFMAMQMPCQVYVEWFGFIQFCQDYFIGHNVPSPLVVEIGIHANLQRPFYKQFLNATHIGIDIDNKYGEPDILGDSRSKTTLMRLQQLLQSRDIDLLFIDGNHSYEIVKQDYETYGPLTRHIVAFHDTLSWRGVKRFWNELLLANPEYEFVNLGATGGATTYGIGIVIKG